jgi:RNA polymerase sigma factor (sigma-70 family)
LPPTAAATASIETLPARDLRRRAVATTELDDLAVQSELRNVLTSALEELPDHYRAVIILHDVEALSMAEVADCLNITVSTAKARAHRARLFLRQGLAWFMSGATSGVEMGS